MYANAPHASATTAPLSPQTTPHQHAPQAQVQHGHGHGMPPALPGGSHGMPAAPAPALAAAAPTQARVRQMAPAFVTGAYQASGDPAIDRMIRLEAACKRFGSPL